MPSVPARSVSLTDLAMLLALGAVWGGAFLFFRIASPEVGPLWAAEARIALGAALLLVVAGRRSWATFRGRLGTILVVGALFSAIPFTGMAIATLTLPTGLASLFNAATPLFTAVLGVVVLRQRLAVSAVVGLGVGVAAVVVLVGWSPLPPGPTTLIAVAAALATPLSYAIAGTLVKRTLPGIGGLELATGQLTAGALVLLPVAILSGPPGTPSLGGALSLVALGTVSTALAWPLFFRVMGRTTATAASTVTFIVPAFGIAWGALILGEGIGVELVAGFTLVLVSLVLVLGIRLPLPSLRPAPAALAPETAPLAPAPTR